MSIQTFNASGERIRDISAGAAERLIALDKIAVVRNRKGFVVRAEFLGGGRPRSVPPMATRYSFQTRSEEGQSYRYWELREIAEDPTPFNAILRSVQRNDPPPPGRPQ